MDDLSHISAGQADTDQDHDKIVLASVGQKSWLLQGEAHLYAMLTKSDAYPTPVLCVDFPDLGELHAILATENVELEDLWTVHEEIVSRLRKEGELMELVPSASA